MGQAGARHPKWRARSQGGATSRGGASRCAQHKMRAETLHEALHTLSPRQIIAADRSSTVRIMTLPSPRRPLELRTGMSTQVGRVAAGPGSIVLTLEPDPAPVVEAGGPGVSVLRSQAGWAASSPAAPAPLLVDRCTVSRADERESRGPAAGTCSRPSPRSGPQT